MGYIYILTSPIGKSYIGQTTRPIEKRFKAHQLKSSKCLAIYNAIKKYGWENFEKDWYECPDEDLNFDEDLLVTEMRTLTPYGYNIREGGGSHGKHSEETKQKCRETKMGEKNPNYGKSMSEEQKQKISEALWGEKNHNYGKPMSIEIKQKLSEALRGEKNPNYGKPMSEEQKQKIGEAQRGEKGNMYGKVHAEETKQKMSDAHLGDKNHNSKRVYQYDLDGTFITSFGSTGEAERKMNKPNGSSIKTCARGKSKTAYGFKWSYTN